MRRLFLALALALAPASAIAQGVSYQPGPEWYRPGSDWLEASPVIGIADFGAHGSGLPSWVPAPAVVLDGADYRPGDATWPNQGTLGGSLSRVGAPLAWYGSPFYPSGFEEASHVAVRPSSIGDYYQHGTGSDALDVMGGGCVLVYVDTLSTTRGVAVNGNESTTGWRLQRNAGNFLFVLDGYPGTPVAQVAATLGLNDVCFGFTSTKAWIVVNATASAEVSVSGTYSPGTTSELRVARSGGLSGDGHGLVEFIYTSVPMSLEYLRAMSLTSMRCASAGPCLPEDSGTLAHLTFDATGAPIDSKGRSWTKQGTPSTSSFFFVWPGNRTPLAQPATHMTNGNVWDGGALVGAPERFTVRHFFKLSDVSGANYLVGKFGSRGWMVYAPANYLTLRVCTALACSNSPSLGSVEAGAWYVLTVSYDYAGGSATVRSSLNGVSVTSSGVSGPIQDDPTTFRLGLLVTGAQTVARSEVWSGWAASTAEADALTRHGMGLLAQRPAGATVAFARNDAHSACCPVSDASCHKLGANMPCLTRAGIERAGPTSNLVSKSETFTLDGVPWTSATASAPTMTSGTWTAPNGSVGWTMEDTSSGAADNQGITGQFTTDAGTYVCSVWAKTITTSAVFWRSYVVGGTGHGITSEFTLTPVPQRYFFSFTAGAGATAVAIQLRIGTASSGTSTGQIGIAGLACHSGTIPGPYRSTTGTPYSGPATEASLAWVGTNPDRWALSVLATVSPAPLIRMLAAGVGGSGGNTELYLNAANYLIHQPTDGLGGHRSWFYGIGAYPVATQRRYTAYVAGGEPGGLLDDVRVPGSLGNSWSGSMRKNPTTLRFGSSGTAFAIEGHVKRVVQCRSEKGCR